MDCLSEPNEKLVEFGVGGICNCAPDPANAAVLVANGGIPLLISCLSSPVENTVLSSMVSLYYLCTHATRKDILIPRVVESLRAYASTTANPRFQNVAKAFLDKYVDRSIGDGNALRKVECVKITVGAPGCPHWSILIIISHFKAKA
jgi:hypothetical protein